MTSVVREVLIDVIDLIYSHELVDDAIDKLEPLSDYDREAIFEEAMEWLELQQNELGA